MAKKPRQRLKPTKPPKFERTYIREWRVFRDLSQTELCDAAAPLSEGYLSSLENGQQPYNQRVMNRIAKALDTTVLALLSGPPTPEGIDPVGVWLKMSHADRVRSLAIINNALELARGR